MANVVKKDGGQGQSNQPQQGQLVRRDPFQQLARDPFQMLMRDPFQLMREMMVDPYRLLQLPLGGLGRDVVMNPQFDIRETDDAIVFKADMPGIRVEDLDISLVANQLQISGKREQEQEKDEDEGRFHTIERSYGSFVRSFALPDTVDLDNVRSDLRDGVLTLVVPKKPGSSPQRRKIQIGSGSKS